MSDISDYTRLVTSEHSDKPKFMAMVALTAQSAVDSINLVNSFASKFDVDRAIGEQLDFTGQWIGLSRTLRVPISGVYFSFDTEGVGFDEGIWFVDGDPEEGAIAMDDDTYRVMLKAKIAANIWDGSLGHANRLLADIFVGGAVQIKDNFDMTETIVISGTAPSQLFAELVAAGYIQLKSAGVGIT